MLVAAIIAAIVANRKKRDISAWVAWAFILPPSLLVLLCLGARQRPPSPRPTLDEEDAMLE